MKRKSYQDTGTEPQYDEFYDNYRLKSNILHGRNTLNCNLSDENGLGFEKNRLIGNKDGKYWYAEGNRYDPAIIPELERELGAVTIEWQAYRQSQINMGFRPPEDKPNLWPPELKERRLKLEAEIDVRQEELGWLNKELTKLSKLVEADRSEDVLKYGCRESYHLKGQYGSVSDIDGQKVKIIEGIPVIQDSASPYDGMAVVDYREFICPAWREIEKSKGERQLADLQEQARQGGLPVPSILPPRSMRLISKTELPQWPKGVRKYADAKALPSDAVSLAEVEVKKIVKIYGRPV